MINHDDYYKPILVKTSFKNNCKYYESRGDKNKRLSVNQYICKITPYLRDIINENKANEKSFNEWKIQINMHLNFLSSNYTGEIRTIFVRSNNEEIRLGNETDDFIKGLINSFLNNYHKETTILRNGSNFVFESVDLLSYHIHKVSLKRGKSYINSPEWVLNKKATINPKNKDGKYFQHSINSALNHQNIENHAERTSNIKPFISQYNWEGIDFLAGIKDLTEIIKELLLTSYLYHTIKTINLAYKSKYNRKGQNQVVLLMTTKSELALYCFKKCT